MNEVQQKTNASLPANVFEQDASKGLGNISQQDLALPFLKILGQLSPEVNERDGKYVKGAKAGMIFNSVTGELYDGVKGIDVIPCFYKLEYIEWKDRGEGLGAPIAIYDSSSDIMSKTKPDANYKDRLPLHYNIELNQLHKRILIEGESGLGKSSLCKLLAGYFNDYKRFLKLFECFHMIFEVYLMILMIFDAFLMILYVTVFKVLLMILYLKLA